MRVGGGREQGLAMGSGSSWTHSHSLTDIDPGAHDVICSHSLEEKPLLVWEAPGSCSLGGGVLNGGTPLSHLQVQTCFLIQD